MLPLQETVSDLLHSSCQTLLGRLAMGLSSLVRRLVLRHDQTCFQFVLNLGNLVVPVTGGLGNVALRV